MTTRMGTFEMFCWATFIAGVLFFVDKFYFKDKVVSDNNFSPPYSHYLSDEDKATLCKPWKECATLQEAIVYESRGEPLEGKRLVAQVVLNRVEHPHWPDSVEEVVHEPKQFSYVNDKHLQKEPTDEDWVMAGKVAYNLLTDQVEVDSEATFYHNTSVKPNWAKHKEVVAKVGNHIFYKGGK